MASQEQHLQRAEQNEALALSIRSADPLGDVWAVVVIFYSALHYVEAYLSARVHCKDHHQRDDEIKKDDKIKPIFKSYKFLYTLSREARYECDSRQVHSGKAILHFENVKRQVHQLLENRAKTAAAIQSALGPEPSRPMPGQPAPKK